MVNIEKPNEDDLKKLATLYKEVFTVHNIFIKPDKDVLDYLQNVDGEILVAKEEGKVLGGCLVESTKNQYSHSLWRIKHLAIAKGNQHHGVGSAILDEIEDMIKERISIKDMKSAKIEVHVAENEKESIGFYKKHGFEVEGELKDHYRKGEICYILGKSF